MTGKTTTTEAEKILHRVCFTGHRPEKLDMDREKVYDYLRREIKKAVADGYVTFISGMARGIDVWAAELVLEEKKTNPELHLICALPFDGFEKSRSYSEKEQYYNILKKADITRAICPEYSLSSFQKRNEWMVDRCSRVIAVYTGEKGGTKNTIAYAKRKGVEVRNICEIY